MMITGELRIALIERIVIIRESEQLCSGVGADEVARALKSEADGIRTLLRRDREKRPIGYAKNRPTQGAR